MASTSTTGSRLETEDSNAFEEIAPPSACSSATVPGPWDIFINHRGPDVKVTLARAIYNALHAMGFRVFLDSEELQLGNFLPEALQEAMLGASLHVAIFSPGYAQSPWCLAELSFMLKSGKPIIPVFYCVEPTDLRGVAQGKGVYVNAFLEHEGKSRYSFKKIEEWKMALHKASLKEGEIIKNDKK
ncbi:probable 2' cyclic ADP-D-ribose synthase BdTIR [Cryptomeria japonica]|uniref:probable 2' cyclic ADP-D-ribose synthase BdTIR n=1 Tax=Cryptomeria japonica TaxID=3369 RepID=UPI0025AD0681|nr:probable 2' cyclic ADP-D-ribose synthase BdTIR [Cryptomeria japonica]